MTKAQRKLHLLSWIVLSICIPLGFISSFLVIPDKIMQENVFLNKSIQLENILTKSSHDNLIVLLRSDSEKSKYQLEVIITTPFKTPEVGTYISSSQNFIMDEAYYLGNLGSANGKLFSLPSSLVQQEQIQVVLFDPIKNELLKQITITP
ncbi:hypothetical protein [Marinifilum caeruleilacunae]|uniref:DUF4352 domain-containing protein n=1 Tax=Marinifilum caeruleilacunae TaxID=2499076 RepID=A0ABX1WZR0_9BACT|nr:hypothetical protein [Marinifilum caeruleilacunae]NOU61396.1 hypothetical protein [Marinifilum caeruleilacunae]